MSTASTAGGQAHHAARRAANSRLLDRLARLGMVCRGVLYALVGLLALQIAFGSSDEEADKGGAINSVAEQPFGTVVLWLMVAGFAALALWQLSEALIGAGETSDRVKAAARTTVYALIVATLLGVVLRSSSAKSSDQQSQDLTASLLDLPGGQFLVGAVGLGIIGLGGYWIYEGVTKKFLEELSTEQMSARSRSIVEKLGLAGYLARGVIAVLAGIFITQAAITYDPDKAKGIDDTLRSFADTPAGPWLLAAVAAGLILFAGYCFAEARWRRV